MSPAREGRAGRNRALTRVLHEAVRAVRFARSGPTVARVACIFLLAVPFALAVSREWVAVGPVPDASGPRPLESAASPSGRPRIVPLLPAATELLVALGAGDLLVARAADDRSDAVGALPVAGTVLAPNPEVLRALDPTLVLVAPEVDRDRLARVLGPRIDVRTVRMARLSDFAPSARWLGRLLARDSAAEEVVRGVEAELAAAARSGDGCAPRVALWAVGLNPPLVAGPSTLPDDLLGAVGAINAMHDAPASWIRPSLEALVALPVDIVIWPVGGDLPAPSALPENSPWHRVPAVRRGDVIELEADRVHEAGPQVGRAARDLADALSTRCAHPLIAFPERPDEGGPASTPSPTIETRTESR